MITKHFRTLFIALCPALLLATGLPDPAVAGADALAGEGAYVLRNPMEHDLFYTVDRALPGADSIVHYRVGDGPIQTLAGHESGWIQLPPGARLSVALPNVDKQVRVYRMQADGQRIDGAYFMVPRVEWIPDMAQWD